MQGNIQGKFGDFELDEEDIYSLPAAQGSDQSRRYVQLTRELLDQKAERPARPSFGSDLELRPRFAR